MKYVFSKASIEDRRSYIFDSEEKKVKEFFEAQEIVSSSEFRDKTVTACDLSDPIAFVSCESYFSFRLSTSGRTVSVTRSYKGLFESLDEFGGIQELLSRLFKGFHWMAIWLTSKCCPKRSKKQEIIADIFNDDSSMG